MWWKVTLVVLKIVIVIKIAILRRVELFHFPGNMDFINVCLKDLWEDISWLWKVSGSREGKKVRTLRPRIWTPRSGYDWIGRESAIMDHAARGSSICRTWSQFWLPSPRQDVLLLSAYSPGQWERKHMDFQGPLGVRREGSIFWRWKGSDAVGESHKLSHRIS